MASSARGGQAEPGGLRAGAGAPRPLGFARTGHCGQTAEIWVVQIGCDGAVGRWLIFHFAELNHKDRMLGMEPVRGSLCPQPPFCIQHNSTLMTAMRGAVRNFSPNDSALPMPPARLQGIARLCALQGTLTEDS